MPSPTALLTIVTVVIGFVISVCMLPFMLVRMLKNMFNLFKALGAFFKSFAMHSMRDLFFLILGIIQFFISTILFLVLAIFVFVVSYGGYHIAMEVTISQIFQNFSLIFFCLTSEYA